MTLIFSPADTIVGAKVTRIIASSSAASGGETARTPSSAAAGSSALPPSAWSTAWVASVRSKPGRPLPSLVMSGASSSRALRASPGTDAWAAVPVVLTLKRNVPFSATHTPYRRRSPYGMTAPAPSLSR
jgi:hypothetical protein